MCSTSPVCVEVFSSDEGTVRVDTPHSIYRRLAPQPLKYVSYIPLGAGFLKHVAGAAREFWVLGAGRRSVAATRLGPLLAGGVCWGMRDPRWAAVMSNGLGRTGAVYTADHLFQICVCHMARGQL